MFALSVLEEQTAAFVTSFLFSLSYLLMSRDIFSLNIEQKEGEDKARALKVLQAHNAGLTRELGQVDMSLMRALEDNGLTLDSVRLQNTPISRRLGRRR